MSESDLRNDIFVLLERIDQLLKEVSLRLPNAKKDNTEKNQ